MKRSVTTTYLEMTSQDQLKVSKFLPEGVEIIRSQIPNAAFSHFLFVSVGLPWQWYSRLSWQPDDWQHYLESPDVETWVGYLRGTPFGYFELQRQSGGDVEIKFFGIQSAFIGQGLGGYLLSETIRQAWQMGATRVWLHTCTMDHPMAMSNYMKRGFTPYREVTEQEEFPDPGDPLWLSKAFYQSTINGFE
jgi:GNAT superfamily N-acetyltransferase